MPFHFDRNKLKRAQREAHERLTQARRYPAVIVDSSDLDPATNKVRVYREDVRRQVIVNSTIRTVNLPVWVEMQPDKELAVTGIRVPEGSQVFGEALGGQSQPTGGQETVAWSVPGIGFVPGRVEASQRGDLNIHVRAFDYGGGRWDDGEASGDATLNDYDISAAITVTSGYSQYILIYLDPADAALHATAGAPVPGAVTVLQPSDLDAISLPYGVYPLGAVGVAYGQTTIDGSSRFADKRRFLDSNGIVEPGWLVRTPTAIPSGASMVQPGTVRVTAALTVNGAFYVI